MGYMMTEYERLKAEADEKWRQVDELNKLRDYHIQECFKYIDVCIKELGEVTRRLLGD